jgi:branched-subunit amino acid ABC-type transport system permease component
MSTVVLLAITGLGLAALYFLVASGLSLIFGLMGVVNFAHGAFLTIGAYGTWWASENLPGAGSSASRSECWSPRSSSWCSSARSTSGTSSRCWSPSG